MAASVEDIRGWLTRGKAMKATHVIVVCDTYDWGDYPVFVMPDDECNVREQFVDYDNKDMQKVMEVYNLSMDFDEQLAERGAFNF